MKVLKNVESENKLHFKCISIIKDSKTGVAEIFLEFQLI